MTMILYADYEENALKDDGANDYACTYTTRSRACIVKRRVEININDDILRFVV